MVAVLLYGRECGFGGGFSRNLCDVSLGKAEQRNEEFRLRAVCGREISLLYPD